MIPIVTMIVMDVGTDLAANGIKEFCFQGNFTSLSATRELKPPIARPFYPTARKALEVFSHSCNSLSDDGAGKKCRVIFTA